jgi:hypothetical protein
MNRTCKTLCTLHEEDANALGPEIRIRPKSEPIFEPFPSPRSSPSLFSALSETLHLRILTNSRYYVYWECRVTR